MPEPGHKPTTSGPLAYGMRSGVRQRLATYLIGIAIGTLLAGTIMMMRRQAAQRDAAEQQQQQENSPRVNP
jgi:hypothetical protein